MIHIYIPLFIFALTASFALGLNVGIYLIRRMHRNAR